VGQDEYLDVQSTIRRLQLGGRTVHLLNRSCIVTVTGFFEVLLSDIATIFYQATPAALAGDDKVISFNELKSFQSISEATEHIEARRVDDLLRNSIEDWDAFLKRNFKVTLDGVIHDRLPDWLEVFERRNLLVHKDGLVDTRYVRNVGQAWIQQQKGVNHV